MNTTTQIKKRINHDSMWISSKFQDGTSFKYRVTRYNTEISGTSMGGDIEEDLQVIHQWATRRHTSSYGNLFKDLEAICLTCNTGHELITKMKIK